MSRRQTALEKLQVGPDFTAFSHKDGSVFNSLESCTDSWAPGIHIYPVISCSHECFLEQSVPNSASRRRSNSSACSARTQGAMKTGHAPDETLVSVLSDNCHIIGIWFGAMGPWSQPYYFMDLVRIGEFVLAYLLNPKSYDQDSYTIGCSKAWGRLKGCV